jgi:hypothetical protein
VIRHEFDEPLPDNLPLPRVKGGATRNYGFGSPLRVQEGLGERSKKVLSNSRSINLSVRNPCSVSHVSYLASFSAFSNRRTHVTSSVLTVMAIAIKPGQKLVIDNATFHKGGRIDQLVQAAGCEVWYLPPYSPDLNKIERCWSWLKSRIRKQLEYFPTLRAAMEHVLSLVS